MTSLNARPVLSIVTISFNQGEFLEDCIRSVLAQRDGAAGVVVDYIVVDAGSTDGSRDIIERYREHIDTVILEPDQGPADGLNRGFAAARGTLFGYINADDRMLPGAARRVLDWFGAHGDVDVLCGAVRMIDRTGRAALRKRTSDRFDLRRFALGVCVIAQQATFFRRASFERAGGFRVANRISWDAELLVDMALSGARFQSVDRLLGDFRIHEQSLTGSMRNRQAQLDDHDRLYAKIGTAGIALPDARGVRRARSLYRFDLLRQWRYLTVRA